MTGLRSHRGQQTQDRFPVVNTQDSASTAEDSADRESGSVQAVEAATEAPAEGSDDTK